MQIQRLVLDVSYNHIHPVQRASFCIGCDTGLYIAACFRHQYVIARRIS